MTTPNPISFEQAISLLTLAIGHIDRNRPETQCQSSRLAEQVGRLDRVWVLSARDLVSQMEISK